MAYQGKEVTSQRFFILNDFRAMFTVNDQTFEINTEAAGFHICEYPHPPENHPWVKWDGEINEVSKDKFLAFLLEMICDLPARADKTRGQWSAVLVKKAAIAQGFVQSLHQKMAIEAEEIEAIRLAALANTTPVPNDLPTAQDIINLAKGVNVQKNNNCPVCGSDKIILFDSDNDFCQTCKKWFPAL